MPAMATQVHRAALKQQNKRHNKIGHRTKGQVRSLSQGRLSFQSISCKAKHELNKQERRNQVKVVRADKREKTMNKKRSLGTVTQPPFLVCVLVLSPDINPRQVLSALTAADPDATVTAGQQGTTHISCNRFKQRYTFVVPPIDDVYSILDAVKVCTTLLVVWPCCDRSEQILDDEQERLISSIKAQGLPTPVHTTLGFLDLSQKKTASPSSTDECVGLATALDQSLSFDRGVVPSPELLRDESPTSSSHQQKKKAAAQQNLLQEIRYYFPGEDKVKLHQLDKPGDALLCLRQIGAQKQRSLFYRDHRPHLLADRVQLQDDVDSASTCTLLVSGYMRGVQLSVDGLVHVPGWGDYQLTRLVCHGQDPHPLVVGGRVMAVEEKDTVMEADPSQQESLQSTREPGSEDHEIGHDDEDDDDEGLDDSFDVSDDDDDGSKSIKSLTAVPMKLDKIPGAYSAYQAAWMIDNDAYKDDGSETDDSSGSERDEFEPTPALAVEGSEFGGDDEEDRLSTVSGSELSVLDDTYDEKVNYDNEMDEYSRILESRDDLEFPDEVDTPRDMPARERFHKYKPLESFRTSPWDLSADLPREYNKIFHIPKFEQFRKKVLSLGLEREGCMPGQYVTLHIKAVEKHLYLEHQKTGSPLVIFGLLPHEQKMSVVHLSIKSHPDGHKHPIKSKERLIFHVGFRRFVNQPIFNEHTAGDKQKLCRYFHPGTTVVASMYAPVCYPPASTLVFRERPSGRQELVATGSVYSINADRCVLKRIILSGHPFKIHKRSVVVRYMFFDRDDINWYKPIELRTKWGRKGKIKEALGTHGHMKCMFNGTLKSQDTILLNLYKRVFPKWTYNEHVSRCAPMYRPDTLEAIGCDSSEGEEEGGESKEQRDRELMPPPSKRPKKVQFC